MHTPAPAVLCVLLGAAPAGADAPLGKGGYALTAPRGMKLPPRALYRTPRAAGKMPTNDWWSSLAWQRYSSNQFPHPLGVRADRDGLHVCYPGARIHATAKHVFAAMTDELVLGHSAAGRFEDARVDGFSDWFVDVLLAAGPRSLRVSYGHGSPFVYALFAGGAAAVRFADRPTVWSGGESSAVLGVSIRGCHYGLFGPSGSTWSGLDGRTFTNHPKGKKHFSLALLPDNRPATLRLFAACAHRHVVDTRVAWKYVPQRGAVETTFTFKTAAREGPAEGGTLFALYPHQWQATRHKLLAAAYRSIRGPMKLAAGGGFTTSMRFPGVLPALPGVGRCEPGRLRGYLVEAARRPVKDAADTYWSGKALGVLTNLAAAAEQAGEAKAAAAFRAELKRRLQTWFTPPARGRKRERFFVYDKLWGTLIGHRASYGSDSQLNDHHFHYGYFVRAAAEVARADKAWAAEKAWGAMVRLLIRDMACGDRADGMFPFLRCFDPYAGHSWASGHARFGDGNNQESCSEAMNAWTGVLLWGEAVGDRALRDLGIYLYTTELHAINDYWFDVTGRLFPKRYAPTCAALIWGGKTDYATWFSGECEHVHGIILLPIQSGSLYLGLYPQYVRRNLAGLAELRGGDRWKHWPDVLWPYEALGDAEKAMRRFERGSRRLDVHARPHVYHWIGVLQALGNVDRGVTADHPTAVAFRRGQKRTHVAYNMTAKPVTVRFSDGATLRVGPNRFATGP